MANSILAQIELENFLIDANILIKII